MQRGAPMAASILPMTLVSRALPLVLALGVLPVLAGPARADVTETYTLSVAATGVGLSGPVAAGVDGSVYVVEGTDVVRISGGASTVVGTWADPTGVAVDTSGDVYVTYLDARGAGYLDEVTPGGTRTTIAGKSDKFKDPIAGDVDRSGLPKPRSVAVDRNGDIFVASVIKAGTEDILEITRAGQLSILAHSLQPGQIAVGNDGSVYADDPTAGTVTRVAPTSATLASGLVAPQGLATDTAGDVFVATSDGNIDRIQPTSGPGTIATLPAGSGLAVDEYGDVLAVDKTDEVVDELAVSTRLFASLPTAVRLGVVKVGATATATLDDPWVAGAATLTPSYQWYTVAAGVWTPIPGATAASYTPPVALAGQQVGVEVSASSPPGFVAAAPLTSAVVTVAKGTLAVQTPYVVGQPRVGATLNGASGPWAAGTAPVSGLTYQWRLNGSPIRGATGTRLHITKAEQGKVITLAVTGGSTGYQTTTVASGKIPVQTPPHAPQVRGKRLVAWQGSAVAGQAIRFSGRLPSHGRRSMVIEKNDVGTWFVEGRARSSASGAYTITTKQGAMDVENYRVVAGSYHSNPVVVHGVYQVIDVTGPTAPRAGVPFHLTAAAHPAVAGRAVTFQQRNPDGTWTTVGRSGTDKAGHATISAVTADPASTTYRVLASAYDGMSWYTSLPLALVTPTLDASLHPADKGGADLRVQPSTKTSAGVRNHWGHAGEDWNWEFGQSLDPWTTYSSGSGQGQIYAGMLALSSGAPGSIVPDYGGVTATLRNHGHAYGRWEWRVRAPESAKGRFDPYAMDLQLVPTATPDALQGTTTCAPNSIDVASWTGYGSRTTVSASKAGRTFSHVTSGQSRDKENWHTYAVQVTPTSVTWLIDDHVVAVAHGAATGQALVPRMELRAPAGVRMTHATLGTDWLRYYPLGRGKQTFHGPAAAASTSPAACS